MGVRGKSEMKNSLNCDFNMINMIHVIKRKYGD